MADFLGMQFYVPTILLWVLMPFLVELLLRKGTIRNLGFLRTKFRRSLPLYIALAGGWAVASPYFATFFFHPAFVEELCFRGFLQTRLERLFSVRRSIIIQAAVFAAYHIPAALPVSKLGFSPGGFFYPVFALLLGIVNGMVYAKTRNLFVTMAIHGSLLAAFELLTFLYFG